MRADPRPERPSRSSRCSASSSRPARGTIASQHARSLSSVALLLWILGFSLGTRPPLVAAAPAASRFSIEAMETEAGLPQNSVIALTQARDGYLWLGTLNGLVRYDGFSFRVFDENNTPGLNSSRIVHLFEDSRRVLWIGTETAGIVTWKDGQISSPPELALGGAERRLVAACEDASGAVWLCTANGEIWRHHAGRFTPFVLLPIAPSTRRLLMAEPGGPVWLGTDLRQVAVGPLPDQPMPDLPVAAELPSSRLDQLLPSRHGGYWRLAGGMIERWSGTNRVETRTTSYPWGSARVTAACEDTLGHLVVGTLGAGVFWLDESGAATRLTTEDGLSNPFILSLVMDREGTLWVGTDGGGLNRVKRKAFDALAATQGWVVQSVAEDADGGLWIASNDNGAGRWKDGVLSPGRGLLASASTRSVFVDRLGNVHLGTRGGGLFAWQDGAFHAANPAVALHPVVNAIHESPDGTLWYGTEAGLARRDGSHWSLIGTAQGLSADAITALAHASTNGLWIGTRGGGLNLWRDGRIAGVFRKKDRELPSDDVSALAVDADHPGTLWIGTGSGLVRLRDGRWTRYGAADGLASDSIAYLLDDQRGNLWAGSNKGLMQIAKRELVEFAEGRSTFVPARVYRRADGLPTAECTAGSQPAACRTRDGRLWFSTIKGLVSVNPNDLRPNTNPPPVLIESISIEGLPPIGGDSGVRPDHIVTVPAGRQRVDIRYASLNLGAPERARFRYRLEGHENDWTQAGNGRAAHYSRLPAGTYRFVVTACNEDGVWNDAGASATLAVLPPYWATWWFRTGTALVVLGLVAGIVFTLSTQRLQRQLATMRQQEALEKERARIARDIHDQLGASLTQLALLGELVEADKDSPSEIEGHARQICQSARDTTRTLDEIVWTVNPSNDTLEGVVNYVCKYAQDYLGVAGLMYRLEIPPQVPDASVAPEVRHNLFLAAKEAITNVVRHAHASSAWLRLHLDANRFTLEIADDGRGLAGMDAQRAATRNGLTNMRRRMEDIGGAFEFLQRPGGGTVVRLTAPFRAGPHAGKSGPPVGSRAHGTSGNAGIDSNGKAG